MKLIDISRPLHTGMVVWPGDTPTEFTFAATKAGGYSCNVGRLVTSMHAGTHVDAPYHFDEKGAKIDELALDTYVGPARVIDARGRDVLTPDLLAPFDWRATPRVLFRTNCWANPAAFPNGWPRYAPELPAWLGTHGMRLVGMDFPSVDQPDSKDLATHHGLEAARVLILENLDLRAAEPGVYELIALPLKIRGGDGSPVRAVLRRD
jgi:arylformamidase